MRDKARVVGMLRACIASEQRYSRMDDRRTARPSADREKGVRPEPLSCNSYVRSGSLGCGVTSGEELVNKFEGVLGVLTNRNGTTIPQLTGPGAKLMPAISERPGSERYRVG